MTPEVEKMIEEARKLPRFQQVKLALITEMASVYQMGIRKVPHERLADYFTMISQVYAAQFANCVILQVMEKVASENLDPGLVILATEEAIHKIVLKTTPQLNNIRNAIHEDFKGRKEDD